VLAGTLNTAQSDPIHVKYLDDVDDDDVARVMTLHRLTARLVSMA